MIGPSESGDTGGGEIRVHSVDTDLVYLAPGTFVNRRFVSPGCEVNTGEYRPYPVTVRDGRGAPEPFDLDVQGFVLADHQSGVGDFRDNDQVAALYPAEAESIVRHLTGADHVVQRGWMVRTSGDIERRKVEGYRHHGGVQPPAGEVHVDFDQTSAEALARETYARTFPDAPAYRRFVITSLWRAFSPPPQDVPLALCDARSVEDTEGTPNTLVIVDEIPDHQTMVGDWPDDRLGPSASIFHHNPGHRWWYFSGLSRDEVILLKFYDSDHDRAWRVPHTAFLDTSAEAPVARQSIELRSVAYFL